MELIELAKEYDFKLEVEYFGYILDSYINGNNEQVEILFLEMDKKDKIYFLNSWLQEGPNQGEVKKICINALISRS